MPSDFTSCSSGMDFSPPQSHVFLSTRSLSRSLPAIDHEYFEKSPQNSKQDEVHQESPQSILFLIIHIVWVQRNCVFFPAHFL